MPKLIVENQIEIDRIVRDENTDVVITTAMYRQANQKPAEATRRIDIRLHQKPYVRGAGYVGDKKPSYKGINFTPAELPKIQEALEELEGEI